MKLTKAEAISNHRKLWHWIAKRTREVRRKVEKDEYFEFYNLEKISYYCYCCEYDLHCSSGYIRCSHCPIDWGFLRNCQNIGLTALPIKKSGVFYRGTEGRGDINADKYIQSAGSCRAVD